MTRPEGGNLQEDPATHEVEAYDVIIVLAYQWA
jgi:hypothetical protein